MIKKYSHFGMDGVSAIGVCRVPVSIRVVLCYSTALHTFHNIQSNSDSLANFSSVDSSCNDDDLVCEFKCVTRNSCTR